MMHLKLTRLTLCHGSLGAVTATKQTSEDVKEAIGDGRLCSYQSKVHFIGMKIWKYNEAYQINLTIRGIDTNIHVLISKHCHYVQIYLDASQGYYFHKECKINVFRQT